MRAKRNWTHISDKLRNRVVQLGMLAACFVVIAGCQPKIVPNTAPTAAGNAQQPTKSVTVAKIEKRKIGETPQLAADLIAPLQSEVAAAYGGTVGRVLKKRGDQVAKGEVIFTLSSPELHMGRERAALALTNAQQAVDSAIKEALINKAELSNSVQKMESQLEAETKRYNKLLNDYDAGSATKAQVGEMELNLKNFRMDYELLKQRQQNAEAASSSASLELQLKDAQLTLQQSEQALEALEVRASMNGVLAELEVEEGMTLVAGVRVGHVMNLERLMVKTELNEETARLVRGKNELTLAIPNTDKKIIAKVGYLSALMNAESKGYELDLQVDNKDLSLKPGSKVLIQLADEQDQIVVAVPSFSIIREGEEAYVFVVTGEMAEKRKVSLGRVNEPMQEILSGVQAGELLVTGGQSMLKDHDSVKLASTNGQQ